LSKRLFKFGKGTKVQNTKNKPTRNKLKETEFAKNYTPYMKAYLQETGKAVWMPRNYEKFSDEAYRKNAVAYRSINLISQSIASIKWQLFMEDKGISREIKEHPVLKLLSRPNPCRSGVEFIEALISYKLINGNTYILKIGGLNEHPQELHLLRPDRVSIIAGKGGIPAGYQYKIGDDEIIYPVDPISGKSAVLHIKYFHPLNDWYGLSPIEAAANSIDQNNNAGTWNQSLLQNGAKPSGALVVKTAEDGSGGSLMEVFDDVLIRIDVDEIRPADVVLLKFEKDPQHVAIISDYKIGNDDYALGIIHSYASARKVVEHRFDKLWKERIVAAYRII